MPSAPQHDEAEAERLLIEEAEATEIHPEMGAVDPNGEAAHVLEGSKACSDAAAGEGEDVSATDAEATAPENDIDETIRREQEALEARVAAVNAGAPHTEACYIPKDPEKTEAASQLLVNLESAAHGLIETCASKDEGRSGMLRITRLEYSTTIINLLVVPCASHSAQGGGSLGRGVASHLCQRGG